MNRFEKAVIDALKSAYPEPEYSVTKIYERASPTRWPPDVAEKKGKAMLFVVEVKDTRASDQTFDSQMKRAFATLALNFVRNHDDSVIVVPDGTPERLTRKFDAVFAEVSSQIISLGGIPSLREVWI